MPKLYRKIIYYIFYFPIIILNLIISFIIFILIFTILSFRRFCFIKNYKFPSYINYWEHILRCIETTYCPFEHTSNERKYIQKKLLKYKDSFYNQIEGQNFYGNIRKEIFKIIPILPKRIWYDLAGNIIFLYLPFLTIFILYILITNIIFFGTSKHSIIRYIKSDRYNLSKKMQLRERWFCFYCDLATGVLGYFKNYILIL